LDGIRSIGQAILRCLEAGMDDYLPKPIHKEPVLKMLHKWVKEEKACPKGPDGIEGVQT